DSGGRSPLIIKDLDLYPQPPTNTRSPTLNSEEPNYHVIHRVAAVREHGVARAIFSFAAEHADYLRCDTHEDNAPMRRALTSFGFKECGTITVANGTQRIAYDWLKEALHGSTPASPATR
ncbi:MAG: hypothetical protein E6212_07585, partial [Actinomyces sp.]|nr:hypothetical protein [Actinomyces sp.]